MVKFINLDRHWINIKADYQEKLDTLWSSGQVVFQDLEVADIIKAQTNRKYVSLTNSCTDSITMMIQASIEPGSEVICPAYSYFATAAAISRAGCIPLFVDVDEDYHLDLEKIKLSEKTKGLIFVSLFGHPMEYQKVLDFCQKHDLICLEDAAQSYGSSKSGIVSGSVGTASALSFSPTKPSPAFGFVGAMATDDEEIFDRVNDMKKLGIQKGYLGHNSNPASAQILQLQYSLKLNEECKRRRTQIAKYYDQEIEGLVKLPPRSGHHNWHKYVIQSDQRDALHAHMKENQVETMVHYKTIIPQYKLYQDPTDYPVASKLANHSMSLPIDPWMTDDEIQQVTNTLKGFFL